jgi:hypothetical protein
MEILTGRTFTQNKKVRKLSVKSSLTEIIIERIIQHQRQDY